MALFVDIPTPMQLERLLDHRGLPSISIYVPTGRLEADARVALVEFTKLSREAVDRLDSAGEDKWVVSGIAELFDGLVEDEEFWTFQADSLAVFAGPESLQTFRLASQLEPVVVVSDRFHVKPLLRAVTFLHEGFVLALAEGSVRLLEFGPAGAPTEVPIPDLPTDAKDPRSNKVVRSRPSTYVRRIDQALRPVLHGLTLPLILSATETIAALFRTVNTYPYLAEERVAGNPETLTDAELVASARPLLDAIYADEVATVRELFEQRSSQGRSAADLSDVARLATMGAVDTLLVDIDTTLPGAIDEATGAITFADESQVAGDDLEYGILDEVARRVLRSGGRVLAVRGDEIPGGSHAAAILRFTI